MSVGLVALLDDIAALAKLAAASIDDIAGQAAKAGVKAAGVVIDDTAVTPRYVTEFSPARELPIIGRIALGSLRNKLLILLPAALALGVLLPGAITPLLMIGGAYLCYEGAEKLYEVVFPHEAQAHEATIEPVALDARTVEDQKIASAIKTDFILSAEIIAITLGAAAGSSFLVRAGALTAIALLMTVFVYGFVAAIVKLDDAGLHMSKQRGSAALGRAILFAAPWLMKSLSVVGTAAMFLVGGGILSHGIPGLHDKLHHLGPVALTLADALIGVLAGALTLALVAGASRLRAGALALLLTLTSVVTASAAPARMDWLCARVGEPKQKVLVSLYAENVAGKSRHCAVIAQTDSTEGLAAFRSCAGSLHEKGLDFPLSPVCLYRLDVKKARLSKLCDWSDETSPAPPQPVYQCVPVADKE